MWVALKSANDLGFRKQANNMKVSIFFPEISRNSQSPSESYAKADIKVF